MNKTHKRKIYCFGLLMALSCAILPSADAQKGKAKSQRTVGDLLQGIQKNAKEVTIQKKGSALPTFRALAPRQVNLYSVKPPASSQLFYEEGSDEAELEKVTDQGINQLYRLTQQFKNSTRRGELWMRLAELYVEKSRLIEYRLQQDYDKKLVEVQEGKTKTQPKLNLGPAKEYNQKAIQLYEWFIRDFPKDPKVDQALFFLGYNYFELSNEQKGKQFYERLTKEFPKSPFIDESNFALGEFYFEKEEWKTALGNYGKVARNRRARLFSFALYKAAWCQYKLGQVKSALTSMETVIRAGRVAKGQSDDSTGGVSRIRLASEASKDLVIFYAEVGEPKAARAYFEKVVGGRNAISLLDKLAYYYADTGNREGARLIFKDMIDERPNAPKAYDYQYQIVSMYASAGNDKVFREELYQWIERYGPTSVWSQSNKSSVELVSKANLLIETTLRNYILQQHQTAQNSKAPFSRQLARSGYELYFQTFKESAKLDEMHFFYAELLFDMNEHEKAAFHYLWVADNAPKSPYYEKSLLNSLLALEKKLPTPQEVKKIVGESTEPVEFDRTIKAFEKVGLRYVQSFPKGEDTVAIKYKIGSLYYYYNQFDRALALFNEIIQESPKTKYAEYSANLVLDIYNIRKDYDGLERAGAMILAIPSLASSGVGNQIKGIVQRASFKKAQDFEAGKDYLKSGLSYEEFAKNNPTSDLVTSAHFNAAVNYERGGDLFKAIGMYSLVLASRDSKAADLKSRSSKFLASLYEKTGQYEKAAGAFEAYAKQNPKDKESVTFYFNAAVIRDGLNSYNLALANYQKYFDMSRAVERTEAIFLMGKIWERRKNLTRAMGYYKQYMDANPRNAAGVVEASFLIAQLSERLGRKKAADENYQKTIAIQRRLSARGEAVGVAYAAESRFKIVYKTYEEFRRIAIPKNPAAQGKAVQSKLNYLNRLKEELKSVIAYDDGHMVVAALALLGQAYQHMSAAIYNTPIPAGLDAEGVKQYKAGVEQIAKPLQDEARNNYISALERGRALEGYNEWIATAAKELSNIDPEKYSDGDEKVSLTKVPDWLEL